MSSLGLCTEPHLEPQKVLVKNEGKTVHGSYGNEETRPKEAWWLTNGRLDLNPGLLGPTPSPFCSPRPPGYLEWAPRVKERESAWAILPDDR